MTQAVCFKCGDIKWGAFNPCEKCGARPKSDDELMLSLAFTDHYFDLAKLQQIGRDIAAGKTPQLTQSNKDKLGPAVQEAKKMIGIDQNAKQQKATSGRRLFYSPGLTWPFFAAVAALIMMWTVLAVQLKLVPSRDNPLIFGAAFGVLGAVAELVGIEGGVVSGVMNLESSGVEASDWRPRHDEQYHEA